MLEFSAYFTSFGVGAILAAILSIVITKHLEKKSYRTQKLREERVQLYFRFIQEVMDEKPYQVTGKQISLVCSDKVIDCLDDLQNNKTKNINNLIDEMRLDLQNLR